MKYLIIGEGYLGNRLASSLEDCILYSGKIETQENAKKVLDLYRPKFLINAAGKTGKPNVDWCENHKDETIFGNVVAPLILARECKRQGVKMVHLGSGCVYQGDKGGKGYSEEDPANFSGSLYSRTKAVSEQLLKEYDVLQLRIRMPIDSVPSPRNLINKLLGYNKIIDNVPNSITIIPDFIDTLRQLTDMEQTGIFNVVNEGAVTHKDILDIYAQVSGKGHSYSSIDEYGLSKLTIAGRSNCVLSTEKLKSLGIKVRDTKESLRECLGEFVKKSK